MTRTMELLMTYAPTGKMEGWEYPLIQANIDDLAKKGWTESEIISKLRWTEHVDPTVDEDVALRNMKLADERVAARMVRERMIKEAK